MKIASLIFHVTIGQGFLVAFACLVVGIYIGSLFCRQISGAPKKPVDEDEHD